MDGKITLLHGDGGKHTAMLLEEIFRKYLGNEILKEGLDAAVFSTGSSKLAFTTDSFVVKPLFFAGGDIGKLAVCGTINDLVVSGARPLYLSAGFIIEEGFAKETLEQTVNSMGKTCREAGVQIITGDTKVVEKGSVDGVFINTSGIGIIEREYSRKRVESGDKIIISGSIGEHGAVIATERYGMKLSGNLKSDCAPLNSLAESVEEYSKAIKMMKDPTRGGLATALNELASFAGLGIKLCEEKIPVRHEVLAVCEMLGFDPLYLACEGRIIMVVESDQAEGILSLLHETELGKDAEIIGSFVTQGEGIVYMETLIGGRRIISPLEGSMLPRIC